MIDLDLFEMRSESLLVSLQKLRVVHTIGCHMPTSTRTNQTFQHKSSRGRGPLILGEIWLWKGCGLREASVTLWSLERESQKLELRMVPEYCVAVKNPPPPHTDEEDYVAPLSTHLAYVDRRYKAYSNHNNHFPLFVKYFYQSSVHVFRT